ncbi:MAG TPA: FtsQ-type POTRA domain-containing protein [Aquihabitans sp.]|nr:FtsQ-type POTRA domain-containing protein [Aquihabitans sp.]
MSSDTLTRGRVAGTPLIDPRLRDRRIEVARDRGRRRLRRVLALVAVLVVAGAALAATRSPLLDVDRVVVRGVTGDQADQVREASGVVRGDALVDVDPGAASRRIRQVPWVASATVVRRWPDGVELRVQARRPVAVAGTGTAAVQVDATGRALAPAVETTDLPTLDAAAPELGARVSGAARTAVAVLAALPDDLRGEVAEVGGGARDLELVLRDGIEVAWGDDGQQTAKADALAALLSQRDRPSFARVDVSVPRASTVTFRTAAGE